MDRTLQLAAIMFTDIKGYTAIMQQDEERAIDIRRRHREIFNAATLKFHGKILQYFGDGTLSIFNSALDAVKCGIEMQLDYQAAHDLPIRIGIHTGEIAISNEDVIGDGVNIASGIESLAVSGSVFISDKVFDEIKNYKYIQTRSMGTFEFSKMSKPIEVYAIVNKGLTVPPENHLNSKSKKKQKEGQKWILFSTVLIALLLMVFLLFQNFFTDNFSPQRQHSIAILPFKNLSANPENAYFSDGIMEAILDHLTKISDLKVISSTSVMQYKNSEKTIPEIAGELDVSYLLEGGVQRYGSKVRIHAQLIDAATDQHIWSETYDRDLTDVFTIQSEVAKQIAHVLQVKIDPEVTQRIENSPTDNPEAYNNYLKARFFITGTGSTGEGGDVAIELLNKAIAADPDFAPAYADLAFIWLGRGAWAGNISALEVKEKALPLLKKAIALDKNHADAHLYLAYFYLWFEWDFKKAEREINIAMELNPSNARIMASSGDFFLATGKFKEALSIAERAYSADPLLNDAWTNRGLCLYFAGEPMPAYETFQTALTHYNYPDLIGNASRVYLYLNKYEEVIKLLEGFFEDYPELRVPRALGNMAIAYFKTGRVDKAEQLLKELKQKSDENSSGSPAFYIAMIYCSLGENDLALQWLEKGFKNHEVEMYWLKVEPPFKPLHANPRFKDLLDRIGFNKNPNIKL